MTKQRKFQHVWKQRTDDGRKREVRAYFAEKTWSFEARYSDETEWTIHAPPIRDDMEELYDRLHRKYQRKRVPWEQLVVLEKMIDSGVGADADEDTEQSQGTG